MKILIISLVLAAICAVPVLYHFFPKAYYIGSGAVFAGGLAIIIGEEVQRVWRRFRAK